MKVSLVAAVARNGVIGRDGGLPWHLPADLARFKALTWGHTLIMGRRTWDSVGRPLPGRRTIVLSRSLEAAPEGAELAADLDAALALAAGEEEVFIAGGEEVYRQALPRADRLYLTRVEVDALGDTRFPVFDEGDWRLVERVGHAADERHAWAFSFEVLERSRSRRTG